MQKAKPVKHYPNYYDLPPVLHAHGVVRLPGSKSISNRILLLSALAQGSTQIFDLLASDDTLVMLTALQSLACIGIKMLAMILIILRKIMWCMGAAGKFPQQHADLFMGNAGTAIRPLTAALAVMGGDYTLHGVHRMHERPIGDLVDALNAIGTRISYTGQPGFPPLHIQRGNITQHHLECAWQCVEPVFNRHFDGCAYAGARAGGEDSGGR